MFKKMIIASEISPDTAQMLNCLEELKKLGAEEGLLIHCYNSAEIITEISEYIDDIYEDNLKKQKEILISQGYKVETRREPGAIREEINRVAVEEGYDVIVAAAPEQFLLGGFFARDAAHEVIHRANKPVLLIRIPKRKEKVQMGCNFTEHILLPTDFSENADLAFEYVKEMVEKGAKKVTVAHVQDKGKIDPYLLERLPEYNEKDMQRMQEMKNILLGKGCAEVDVRLLYGAPSVELLNLIKEQKITLTVMGSQGKGFVKELFLGSVSHNLARHAKSSLLLIPAQREK